MNKKDNLLNFIFISQIIIYGIVLLIETNIFKLSEATQFKIIRILLFFFISMLFAMNFSDSVGALLISNFLLILTLLSSATVIKPDFFDFNAKYLKKYLSFFIGILIILFFNIITITRKLNHLKKPVPTSNIKGNKKINIFLNSLNKIFYLFDTLIYKIRIIFPVLAYIIVICLIILTFAIAYEGNNIYSAEKTLDEGLFYTQSNNENYLIRATGFEILYFSTCTFLNSNDGSIYAMGDAIKLLIQLEMLIAHIVNIIFIPILLFLFYKFFEEKSSLEERPLLYKIKSKISAYKDTIEIKPMDSIEKRKFKKRRNMKSRYTLKKR